MMFQMMRSIVGRKWLLPYMEKLHVTPIWKRICEITTTYLSCKGGKFIDLDCFTAILHLIESTLQLEKVFSDFSLTTISVRDVSIILLLSILHFTVGSSAFVIGWNVTRFQGSDSNRYSCEKGIGWNVAGWQNYWDQAPPSKNHLL